MLRMVLTGFAMLIAATDPISAGSAASLPGVEEILKRMLDRVGQARAINAEDSFAWTRRVISEELDDRGGTKKREERVYEAFPIGGSTYSRLVLLDGKPLSERDLKREQEREQKFRQSLLSRKAESQDDDEIELNEELMSRFQVSLGGKDEVGGRQSYVLSFEPKSAKLPERRLSDRLVNRLRGRIWVDEASYEITKLDAELLEPVKMWGGILGTVRSFKLTFTQTQVEDDIWLPDNFEIRIQGRVFIKSFNQHQTGVNSGFKRVD